MNKLILTFITFLLCSCSSIEQNEQKLKEWKFQKFDWSITKIKKKSTDQIIIDSLKKSFKKSPYPKTYRGSPVDENYHELNFYQILFDEKKNYKYMAFSHGVITHTNILFVIDEKNNLIDNFLVSDYEVVQ